MYSYCLTPPGLPSLETAPRMQLCMSALPSTTAALSASQVTLNLESKAANVRKAKRKAIEGEKQPSADYRRKTGHAFSAENPYGKRAAGDKRQFVRM